MIGLVPGCWRWPLPEVMDREQEVDRLVAAYAHLDRGAAELLTRDWPRYLLHVWHQGRCALCATVVEYSLLEDHCEVTGLVRGLLCQRCDSADGVGVREVVEQYRRRPPAVLLGVRAWYVGPEWPYGWWLDEVVARRLTRNAAWTVDIELGARRPEDDIAVKWEMVRRGRL